MPIAPPHCLKLQSWLIPCGPFAVFASWQLCPVETLALPPMGWSWAAMASYSPAPSSMPAGKATRPQDSWLGTAQPMGHGQAQHLTVQVSTCSGVARIGGPRSPSVEGDGGISKSIDSVKSFRIKDYCKFGVLPCFLGCFKNFLLWHTQLKLFKWSVRLCNEGRTIE